MRTIRGAKTNRAKSSGRRAALLRRAGFWTPAVLAWLVSCAGHEGDDERGALTTAPLLNDALALAAEATDLSGLAPVLECVAEHRGRMYAVFGYHNTNASRLVVNAGPRNHLTPAPAT